MAPEGMVHALETIHTVLEPNGCLIDIHPNGPPMPIEACLTGQFHRLGYLQETDDFIEYGQASAALVEVIQRGLFVVEGQGRFIFITRAGSVDELHTFLTENWTDSIFPAEVELRARELSLSTGQITSAQLTVEALIARMRKISLV
jgi:hypothetical protein